MHLSYQAGAPKSEHASSPNMVYPLNAITSVLPRSGSDYLRPPLRDDYHYRNYRYHLPSSVHATESLISELVQKGAQHIRAEIPSRLSSDLEVLWDWKFFLLRGETPRNAIAPSLPPPCSGAVETIIHSHRFDDTTLMDDANSEIQRSLNSRETPFAAAPKAIHYALKAKIGGDYGSANDVQISPTPNIVSPKDALPDYDVGDEHERHPNPHRLKDLLEIDSILSQIQRSVYKNDEPDFAGQQGYEGVLGLSVEQQCLRERGQQTFDTESEGCERPRGSDKGAKETSPLPSTPQISAASWERYRPAIQKLYVEDDLSLKGTSEYMVEHHGFHATERQYKRKIKDWQLDKNIKDHEMQAILAISQRRLVDRKNSVFYVRGKKVEQKKIDRFAHRKRKTNALFGGIYPIDAKFYRLPTGVECRTPPSEEQTAEEAVRDTLVVVDESLIELREFATEASDGQLGEIADRTLEMAEVLLPCVKTTAVLDQAQRLMSEIRSEKNDPVPWSAPELIAKLGQLIPLLKPETFSLPPSKHPQQAIRQNRPKRTKASMRSRTGCWPCKARKVKCDETRPVCKRCETYQMTCDYSIKLNWGDASPRDAQQRADFWNKLC